MDAINKLHPSVFQCQYPGDWWQEVPPVPAYLWRGEIPERGDFSNFRAWFEGTQLYHDYLFDLWNPAGGGLTVDVGQSMRVESIDPSMGLKHITMKMDASVPTDWGDYRDLIFHEGKIGTFQERYHNFQGFTDTHVSVGNSLTVEQIPDAPEGDYAFKMIVDSSQGGNGNCFARVVFDYEYALYAQVRFKIISFNIGGRVCLFGFDSALGVDCNICLREDMYLEKAWQDDAGYHTSVSSTAIQLNRWYTLKIFVKVGDGDGENRVWLDGVELLDLQNLGLVNTYSPIGLAYIGSTKTFAFDGAATVLFDAMYVGSNPQVGMSRHNCMAWRIFGPSEGAPFPVLYAATDIKITEYTLNGNCGIFGLLGVGFGNAMNLLALDANRRLVQDWLDDAGPHHTVSSTSLTMNEKHRLEVSYKVGNGDGEARVWLDGIEITDLQHMGLVNTVVGGATEIEVGQDEMHVLDQGKATILFGDPIVSTEYIGSGGVVVPDSWYDFYLPSMVNLTRYCEENNIYCMILTANYLNVAGVGLGPEFQWYINAYFDELARQGINPPLYFGFDLEWVRPAGDLNEVERIRQEVIVIRDLVESRGSKFCMIGSELPSWVRPALLSELPWWGHTHYPVSGTLDMVAYEQEIVANGWDQTHFGIMIGLLLDDPSVYNAWTEANIVHIFNEIDKVPNLMGVAGLDVIPNMLDPNICPDFVRIVNREVTARGYITSLNIPRGEFEIIDPLYTFTAPSLSEIQNKFALMHNQLELIYQGNGYWYGTSFQARWSGRIALGYMSANKVTGEEIYATRAREALDFLLAGQGTNGPEGYWDDFGYETGIGLAAMVEGYKLFGDDRYLNSALAAGDAIIRENLNLHTNYGAFAGWGLAKLYGLTRDTQYLDKAVELAQNSIANQNEEGYWPGDHSGKFNYHMIYTRFFLELCKQIPIENTFTTTLYDSISRAVNWMINMQMSNGDFYDYPDKTSPTPMNAGSHMRVATSTKQLIHDFKIFKVQDVLDGLTQYVISFDPLTTDEGGQIMMLYAVGEMLEAYSPT